jgi:hypothetical protein
MVFQGFREKVYSTYSDDSFIVQQKAYLFVQVLFVLSNVRLGFCRTKVER